MMYDRNIVSNLMLVNSLKPLPPPHHTGSLLTIINQGFSLFPQSFLFSAGLVYLTSHVDEHADALMVSTIGEVN